MGYNKLPTIELDEVIKPAGEMEEVEGKNFLIVGPTGSGKTYSKTTIPNDDLGLDLDHDGKNSVVRKRRPEGIDVVGLKYDINAYDKQLATVNAVYDNTATLAEKYQWCFVDGLTNFYALGCRAAHDNVGGGNKFKLNFDKMDYVDDWVWRRLQRFMVCFKYFVLFAHEDYRDVKDGTTRILPLCRKRLSHEMARNFQEVYHATPIGFGDDITYAWMTRSEENCGNTSGIIDLPHTVPNNFAFILGVDWEKVGGVEEAIGGWRKKGNDLTGWKLSPRQSEKKEKEKEVKK